MYSEDDKTLIRLANLKSNTRVPDKGRHLVRRAPGRWGDGDGTLGTGDAKASRASTTVLVLAKGPS